MDQIPEDTKDSSAERSIEGSEEAYEETGYAAEYTAGETGPVIELVKESDLPESKDGGGKTPVDLPVLMVALATFTSGITGIVQPLATRLAVHPKLFFLLNIYDYYHWSKMLSVSFGLFLIFLSVHIVRRKKQAWLLTFSIASLSALVNAARFGIEHLPLIKDSQLSISIPAYTVVVPLLTVVLLWFLRHRFTVRSEIESLSEALALFLASVVLLVAYGTLGFWLLEIRDFGMNFEIDEALQRALKELALVGNTDIAAKSRFAVWFLHSLKTLEVLAGAYCLYSLFRPIHYRLVLHAEEIARAGSILDKHGRDALDYYKLLEDKSLYFEGDSFVAYTTSLNVAICLGDPVGPEDQLEKLVSSFRSYCHERDWKLAFLQVSDRNRLLFEKLKLEVLKVGEDAVVDLDEFVARTVKGKSFKATVKKFEKQGFTVERHSPPHDPALISTVRAVSDAWLSLPGRRERGFSLGWFDEADLQKDNIFVLYDKDRNAIAFVNQVRSYQAGQASIDMMRHGKDVPNGSMDFLFARLFTLLEEAGYHTFNLGLAALSGVGDKPGASLEEKACHQIYERMNRFFSYKGLRQYKSKFKPTWQERFLIYEGGAPGLIRTALAITRAGEITD